MKAKLLPLVALMTLSLAAAAAQGKAFTYRFKTKFAAVEFSWSSEAAAVPTLVKRFRAELAKDKADTIAGGKDDYATRQIGWESSTKITTSGESPRLLSLSREDWEFTGGAHGNGGTSGLLWDRRLAKEIQFGSLFSSPSTYAKILRGPYCAGLDAERKKRRGDDDKLGTIPEFDSCPKLSDLAIIPADSSHDGRFDRIHLIASAYLAGPYVEGEYDIALPVTPQLIAMMKPEYRSSFEAQRQ